MDEYIKPISPENPAGQDIEYDEDYIKLLSLVQEKPEQQFGDLIIDAQGPDWEGIYNLSNEILLNKSKNLHVMSFFTQSSIVRYGLKGLADGLEIIQRNLAEYWDDVHPKLIDEDGDFDPDYRVNALSLFFSNDGILKEVRNSYLIKNGLSQTSFNVREIEAILENRIDQIDQYPGGLERLNIDLQIGLENSNPELIAIQRSKNSIDLINKIFEDHLDDAQLRFDVLDQLLDRLQKGMTPTGTNQNESLSSGQVIDASHENLTKGIQNVGWSSYQIQSRQDVELLLEKIYIYFEKNEPSHPAPLFIRRIQKLLNLNFYQIMKDISPDSLDRLENLVGQPIENQNED